MKATIGLDGLKKIETTAKDRRVMADCREILRFLSKVAESPMKESAESALTGLVEVSDVLEKTE